MKTKEIQVLLVECEKNFASLVRQMLEEEKRYHTVFYIESCKTLDEAQRALSTHAIDVILLDLSLPDSKGIDTLIKLYQISPDAPIIVITKQENDQLALDAMSHGAEDYFIKDQFDKDTLSRGILYALERHRIKAELKKVTADLYSANARLNRLVLLDPLTELLNRKGLQQVLSREVEWAKRDSSTLLAMHIDLDNFKQVNDTFGYAVGDMALREISYKLRDTLRSTDYVGRIGGDEFLALLPETRLAEGMRLAERVRLAVSSTPVILASGQSIELTGSIGVVTIPINISSIDELLSGTHYVLNQSKRNGRNRVTNDRDIAEKGEDSKSNLISDVLRALSSGSGFHVVKQPIYRLFDRSIVGYEFLSRSAIKGFENPNDFFRLCLENNMLTLVDHQCFKSCVAAAANVQGQGTCHINLFPSTILDVPVQHLVEAILAQDKSIPFCIELSEQQIIGDSSYLMEPLQELKSYGVQIAIDDVGFGRSCLENLILLEPDILKIDRRCISGINERKEQERTVLRLMKVADALDSSVIAEGIETEEELQQLISIGVEYGQGFLLGKPA